MADTIELSNSGHLHAGEAVDPVAAQQVPLSSLCPLKVGRASSKRDCQILWLRSVDHRFDQTEESWGLKSMG